MKKGFTTGTAAACAATAHAIFQIENKKVDIVDVILPDNSKLPIKVCCESEHAIVIKDSGDDPDVTHGAKIGASVVITEDSRMIIIEGGVGVGTVTLAGLQVEVGKSAINPVPWQMIENNVRNIIGNERGAIITIFVPDGVALAKKTFNSRIGIIGGISIIGTTGIIEPMSLDAIIATTRCEIDVLVQNGIKKFTLVPGKIGEKYLTKLYPEEHSVIVSNYFDEALSYCVDNGVTELKIAGHPGKLAKLAMGYYNTHSKVSPMAQGYVAKLLNLKRQFNTVEEICNIVEKGGLDLVASEISTRIKSDYKFDKVSIFLFDMKGNLKGKYDNFKG